MGTCVSAEGGKHANDTSYDAEVDCNLKQLEPCLAVLRRSSSSLEANLTACLGRPQLLSYRGNPLVDGFYAAHISTWTHYFPRKQLLVVSHGYFVSSPEATTKTLHAIGKFTGHEAPEGTYTLPTLNTASLGGEEVVNISCSAKTRLQTLFAPWNALLF